MAEWGRHISEAEFQNTVIALARQMGWLCYHAHDSRKQVRTKDGEYALVGDADAKGFPDLVLVKGAVLFRELKKWDGQPTPAQRHWMAALTRCGMDVKVWRPQMWSEIEKELTGG